MILESCAFYNCKKHSDKIKSATNQRPGGRFPAVGPGTVNRATDPLRLRPISFIARLGAEPARKQPALTSNRPAAHRSLLYPDAARHWALYAEQQ